MHCLKGEAKIVVLCSASFPLVCSVCTHLDLYDGRFWHGEKISLVFLQKIGIPQAAADRTYMYFFTVSPSSTLQYNLGLGRI